MLQIPLEIVGQRGGNGFDEGLEIRFIGKRGGRAELIRHCLGQTVTPTTGWNLEGDSLLEMSTCVSYCIK